MIKLQAIGHLGRDVAVNTVNGKNVMNFPIAHTEKFKDAQGVQKERTVWVDCAYWSDRTAIAPYLKKGTQVYVDGTPDVRSYTTQDGKQGSSLTLRVNSIQLLGTKNENSSSAGTPANTGSSAPEQNSYPSSPAQHIPQANEITEPVDDLPF